MVTLALEASAFLLGILLPIESLDYETLAAVLVTANEDPQLPADAPILRDALLDRGGM